MGWGRSAPSGAGPAGPGTDGTSAVPEGSGEGRSPGGPSEAPVEGAWGTSGEAVAEAVEEGEEGGWRVARVGGEGGEEVAFGAGVAVGDEGFGLLANGENVEEAEGGLNVGVGHGA